MDIEKIWSKAKNILRKEEKIEEYLNDCKKANICYNCGEELSRQESFENMTIKISFCNKCGCLTYAKISYNQLIDTFIIPDVMQEFTVTKDNYKKQVKAIGFLDNIRKILKTEESQRFFAFKNLF